MNNPNLSLTNYISAFIRTGYNEALYHVIVWCSNHNKDRKIDYDDLAEYLLDLMTEEKTVTSDKIVSEIELQKK